MRWNIVLAAFAAAALAAAPSAHAAPWRQLTAAGGQNIDQVGLARTADGILHVLWHRRATPTTEDVLHTAIKPDGTVGATSTVVSGWASTDNPDVTVTPGGLRAFWGGIRSLDPNDANDDMNSALSSDGGATWALQPGSVVAPAASAYGSPVSVATRPDGTPVLTWYGSLGVWVHSGLDPATPNHDFQAPLGNYGYYSGIAIDSAGRTTIAWYSNATGHLGVFAQGVNPDGSPLGAPLNMPGTGNMSVGQLARTPIVARPGGGVYVAYPTGYPSQNQVRVWAVGSPKTTLLARTGGDSVATIAADPNGRLWVAWRKGAKVFARRSNAKATEWGATVAAGAPKGAASLYHLDANATGKALDLLGNFSLGTASTTSTYATRIAPGLTLAASRSSHSATVRFFVTDAGAPVKGAKVKGGGHSATTDSHGRAKLTLKRRATVTASASGYVDATLRLK